MNEITKEEKSVPLLRMTFVACKWSYLHNLFSNLAPCLPFRTLNISKGDLEAD